MKIVCPNSKPNSSTHRLFITTAHIAHKWIVDEEANCVDDIKQLAQVAHRPGEDDRYVCKTCYTDAKVIK